LLAISLVLRQYSDVHTEPQELPLSTKAKEDGQKPAGPRRGGDLFIVDNSDTDWKVREYLREWSDISEKFDIATGNLEIGGLLSLNGEWQKLKKIRVLMGNEVTRRTRKALLGGVESLKQHLDSSIEKEKEGNDFLTGVPAIVDALTSGQIECRVYNKDKFMSDTGGMRKTYRPRFLGS
jgi:hypothetical protein